MIADLIVNIFTTIGHTWKVSGEHIVPDEDSVTKVLDRAAGVLYARPVGTQIETGGLIIEKTQSGHDVYVYVGNYE